MPDERLQKILSAAGIASRRHAEQLIKEGRVTVNGQIVTELGSKADVERDHVKFDGKLIRLPDHHVYLALHKPDCVMSTAHDPERRTTVLDLLHGVKQRVYPVGRLDYHSTGLILLTNDGEFANLITAGKSHVSKTYLVKINGPLTDDEAEDFRRGIPLSGKRTAPAGLRLVRRGDNPWYEVRLYEGRNQQIRIMFKHFGRLVEKLKRIRIGMVELGTMKPGEFRHLNVEEIARLIRLARGQERKREDRARTETGRYDKEREGPKSNDRKRKTPR